MANIANGADSWRTMVMRSMPAPAWLSPDAPHCDVALSSRCRIMRNLRGHRFPHHADGDELIAIARQITGAGKNAFDIYKKLSHAERDFLVGCRLISPDFPYEKTARPVMLDHARECSVMVNEEDHIRLQAVTAGWSIKVARRTAENALAGLGKELQFAHDPHYGYLAASPYNAGEGRRLSAMFHLIGLASTKRLPSVLQALPARGLSVRGLFGETSRAVGAFVQVSAAGGSQTEFVGACEYLLKEERGARREVPIETIAEKTKKAVDFALPSRGMTLADALRVFAWIRWAGSAGVPGFVGPRTVDAWLTSLEIRGADDQAEASRSRADFLRRRIEDELSLP